MSTALTEQITCAPAQFFSITRLYTFTVGNDRAGFAPDELLVEAFSDGGFARYRVRISPWLWRLGQVRNSRVWQDQTVIQIVDSVLAAHSQERFALSAKAIAAFNAYIATCSQKQGAIHHTRAG